MMSKDSKTDRVMKALNKKTREELKNAEFERYLRDGSNGNINSVTAAERYKDVPFAQSINDGDVEIIIVQESQVVKKPDTKKTRSVKKS